MSINTDEERLYDATAEESAPPRMLDAAATEHNGQTNNSNNSGSSGYSSQNGEPQTAAPRRRIFILEPAVFFAFVAMYLSAAVYQNQILYQTCIAIFHYNDTQCQPLLGINRETEEARSIEKEVQPVVARILMSKSILESTIPALVSLFVGPWSDKFGRRPIILTTFTAYTLGTIINSILAFISTKVVFSPWVFLLASIPSTVSGGSCSLITGVYCYISDVAKEKARAFRMVLNEASLLAGIMLGNVASGYVYAATNVVTLFSISAFLMFWALVYVYFCVEESLKPEQIHAGSKVREFFRFDLVKDLFHTVFSRRPNYDRAIIWLTMITLTIAIFTMEGDGNVTYLFVRAKFDWTLKDYTQYSAARIIVQIIGSLVGMWLLRKILKFSIITMTMISLACCVLESTVRATAVYWWEMYLGMILGLMRGIMGPMARAILSHVAPPTEVGKVYAFTTSMESLSPLGAAPLYTTVYNATLTNYPGAFNFISAGLFLLCYTLLATIYGIQKSLSNTSVYKTIGS